ncbi:MAG: glycosyltransferase family 4 protein, partial [Pseudomonadota bacterium]
MKILLSAFSCGPDEGSEPGIGWNWAVHAVALGHDVTVVTSWEHRDQIARADADGRVPEGLTIDVFMPPRLERFAEWALKRLPAGLAWNLIHAGWQRALVGHVRETYADQGFDFVHHITLGGARHPTLLHKTGMPLVVGPLGGGDRVPFALRKSFPWHGWFSDLARDAYNAAIAFDPTTRGACREAVSYYARTDATRRLLPRDLADKTRVRLELGIDDAATGQSAEAVPPDVAGTTLNVLYVGRLSYLKGMHLGLRAIAEAVHQRGTDVRLTMIGVGGEERAWKDAAQQMGIADRITWLGWVDRTDLASHYRNGDLFLFPSLRDASGNVVLEAMSHGRPVVCLALGGPNEIVTPWSGIAIRAEGRSEQQVVSAL